MPPGGVLRVWGYPLSFRPPARQASLFQGESKPCRSALDTRGGAGSPEYSAPANTGLQRRETSSIGSSSTCPPRSSIWPRGSPRRRGPPQCRNTAQLLIKAVEDAKVRHKVSDIEARRGPLEGLKEIASDPDYLTEWRERHEQKRGAQSAMETDDGKPGPTPDQESPLFIEGPVRPPVEDDPSDPQDEPEAAAPLQVRIEMVQPIGPDGRLEAHGALDGQPIRARNPGAACGVGRRRLGVSAVSAAG